MVDSCTRLGIWGTLHPPPLEEHVFHLLVVLFPRPRQLFLSCAFPPRLVFAVATLLLCTSRENKGERCSELNPTGTHSKEGTFFLRSRVEFVSRGGARTYNPTRFEMTFPCLQHGVPVPAACYMPPETSWRRVAACVEVAISVAGKRSLRRLYIHVY